MAKEDYEAGLMQGQINAIEKMVADEKTVTNKRLDDHDGRFKYIERILWMMVGMWLFMRVLPDIKGVIG